MFALWTSLLGMCEELHNHCDLDIACQKMFSKKVVVVRPLPGIDPPLFDTWKRPLTFCNLYGYLQEAPQYFECLLQTFLVVNGGKMIAGQPAGPIREKSSKHYYRCIPGMNRTTATDINRPVSIY